MGRTSMIRAFDALAIAAIGAMPMRALSQGGVALPARPEIVTSATGEAELAPDRAIVYVGVQTRGATAAAAARDNAQRQRAVIDAIASTGVARAQISTENFSVAPDTRYDQATGRSTVTGYVVSNVVKVEVNRIDQIPAIIDQALGKGANQINSLDFFSSNSDSARHEALAQAISRARGDAEAMARAAGGSLGSLVELTSAESGPRPVYRMQVANAAVAAVPTPIEPGLQKVQVSVSARWMFIAGAK